MSRTAELAWRAAFDAVLGGELALTALALGFPVRGGGRTLLPEAPELRGAAVWLDGSWVRPVVVPVQLERGGEVLTLLARIGAWPALREGHLALRGQRVSPPEDPEALAALGAALTPGALAELLRHNLQLWDGGEPAALLAGSERLLDGLTERLSAQLLLGR